MELKQEAPSGLRLFISRNHLVTGLCIGILLAVILLRTVGLREYLVSKLLVHDDTVFVGSFMFGGPLSGPKAQQVFYSILNFLASGGSEIPPKLLLMFIQAIISLSFYRVVVRLGGSHFIAIALAILACCYPVSADQNYFMSGAHPAAATAVFLVYCVLFVESIVREWITNKAAYVGFLAVQGGLLFVCGYSSPTFTIMPIVLVLSTILAIIVGPEKKRESPVNLMLVGLSAVPALIYYVSIHHHHYSDLIGWTSFSSARVLTNFRQVFRFILVDPFSGQLMALVGYAFGWGILLVACLASTFGTRAPISLRLDPKLVAVLVFLLASSALTFGPSSILTYFLTRYIVPPTVLAFLILAILMAVFLRRIQEGSSSHIMAIRSGVALLAVVAVLHNVDKTNAELAPLEKTNTFIRNALASVPVNDGDQILILLPGGYSTPTAGYNHWSTWYLRVLTGKRDVIGLVGASSMKDKLNASELFVEAYRDHGPEYWDVSDGRSYRKVMKGLEWDRRLFVLSPDAAGALELKPFIYWRDETLSLVPPGQSPAAMTVFQGSGNVCADEGFGDAVPVVANPLIPDSSRFQRVLATSYAADAVSSTTVQVHAPEGRMALLRLVLSSQDTRQTTSASQEYTNTFPPMPMTGPDYSVYLADGNYRVWSKDNGVAHTIVPAVAGNDLSVSLIGCPGRFGLLTANGAFAGVIPEAGFSGGWQLGKGFLDRYWTGEIKSFSVAVASD